MKWGIIATWRMGFEGVEKAASLLRENKDPGDALEIAIKEVEDYPYFKSVGYGGLPNENGIVELDAAYMDGDSLSFGAVASIRDFANPISIARKLSSYDFNNFLVGRGAEEFASKEGFERKNMLTDRALIHYKNRVKEEKEKDLKPYAGHDTVGMVALGNNSMVAGTSTSGLFMKRPGRVGDSPVCGSGFYVDSEIGGATATGLGEDLMKGAISYEIISLMAKGLSPQEACDKAVIDLDAKLKRKRGQAGDLSVVAMDKDGNFGVATNIEGFSFAVASHGQEPQVYVCEIEDGKTKYSKASQEWLDDYIRTRTAPLELK